MKALLLLSAILASSPSLAAVRTVEGTYEVKKLCGIYDISVGSMGLGGSHRSSVVLRVKNRYGGTDNYKISGNTQGMYIGERYCVSGTVTVTQVDDYVDGAYEERSIVLK